MNIRPIVLAALAGLMPVVAQAVELKVPGNAVRVFDQVQPVASTAIPVSAFSQGTVPTIAAEGQVSTEAWQLRTLDLTTFQIMLQLREQLIADGFEILLDCAEIECGGFDFRYEIDLLPEPEMHVDLGDYRFLSAQKTVGDLAPEYVGLMVSRSATTGFVQIKRVGAKAEIATTIPAPQNPADIAITPPVLPAGSLAQLLTTTGSAPLEDLEFRTGSSRLGDKSFNSLKELSEFLNSNPELTIALVGHTDAEGSLANNLVLSKRRASSAMERLILAHGVSVSQMEAAGVGYLAPRGSNQTETGRTKNRRVEVILTSTR